MTPQSDSTPSGRAAYEAPALVVLGSVAELTQQGAGAVSEAEFDGSLA